MNQPCLSRDMLQHPAHGVEGNAHWLDAALPSNNFNASCNHFRTRRSSSAMFGANSENPAATGADGDCRWPDAATLAAAQEGVPAP